MKSRKVLFGIVIVIVVLWSIIFIIDYARCTNFKEPIFVISGETADDGGSGTYYGLGYRVEIEKNISSEYGLQLVKVEMYMFDKIITGAIADLENIQVEVNNVSNENRASFVGKILEETTKYMIVEPNEDEIERKSSDKIVVNYETDHIDYLYGVGRKVLINYEGYIMETYPAQINTDNILVNGYEEFDILIKESNNPNKTKVLNNKDLYKYNLDYDLYYYGLDEVNISVDNKIISLESALKSGKITLDGIIDKANRDLDSNVISGDTYKDGGTMIYNYDNYTIIKFHSLDGNQDVYIGTTEMKYNVKNN